MLRLLTMAGLVCAALPAHAQQTIRIGMINVLSGQFADAGIQMENGARTYIKQHGDTLAGKKIEIIRRDVGGPLPDVAKRHAQELVVRDKIDLLAGFLLTPNALAAADVSAEAKKFMVVMNAATSIIISKSPYMVRTSVTLPQVMETFGTWAVKNGIKQSYTMVTDYGPGHDAEAAFQRAFKEAGGSIVGSVPFRVATPDFSAFVQRAKDLAPQSIYVFIPGGAQPAALGKAFAERGIDKKRTTILGSGETTAEAALKSMGEAALDMITAWHYDYKLDNALNREFVKEFNAMHGRNPDFFSVGGYDGMHVIYEALKNFVNLARCSFAMIGGYVAVTLVNSFGWPFLASLPIAFLAAALVSIVLEKALYRRLYRATDLDQCLFTIGIVFISVAVAAYFYGTVQQPISTPPYLRGSVQFMGMSFAAYRLFLIVTALAIAALLVYALEYTRFGAQVRAAVDNQRMARGLGIDVDRAFAVTFALGGGLAGLGGALAIEMVGLDHAFAFTYLVYVLIVVAVGGLGSIGGSFAAAAVLGISDMAGKYYFPWLGAFLIYLVMVGILMWRPAGLFGKR